MGHPFSLSGVELAGDANAKCQLKPNPSGCRLWSTNPPADPQQFQGLTSEQTRADGVEQGGRAGRLWGHHAARVTVAVLWAYVLLMSGSALAGGLGNTPPVIDSIHATPTPIPAASEVTLTCNGSDTDGSVNLMTFSVSAGTLTGGTPSAPAVIEPGPTVTGSVTWSTPEPGTYTVTCQIWDSGGLFGGAATTVSSVEVDVEITANVGSPPAIQAFTSTAVEIFGAATSGTTTTLVDLSKSWTNGGLVGLSVRITDGANNNGVRVITSNTNTQIDWALATAAPIQSGDTYEIDVDGNVSNNLMLDDGGAASFTTGNVLCTTCHAVHYADSNSSTYDDAPRPGGDGMLLRRTNNEEACVGCHDVQSHNSGVVGDNHGTWGTTWTCGTCHQPHDTANLYLFRPSLNLDGGECDTVNCPVNQHHRNSDGVCVADESCPSGDCAGAEICSLAPEGDEVICTCPLGYAYDGGACALCAVTLGMGFAMALMDPAVMGRWMSIVPIAGPQPVITPPST